MGGNTFETVGKGTTVEEAFKEAVKDAEYEYGHRGYTGTIAEKEDFVIIPESEYLGKYDARWYAGELVRKGDARIVDKWGPAGAIKLDDGRWLFFGWASS